MNVVIVIIEKTKDMYSAYTENVPGIYGGGETIEAAAESIKDAIRLLKEHNAPEQIPTLLKDEYSIDYRTTGPE